MTPAVAVHAVLPDSKPGLTSFCPEQPAPPPPPIVHVNDVVPLAPVVSVAVTVGVYVAAVVGVPLIRPVEELIDRPAGSPAADQVSVWPDCESVAVICR